VILAIGAVLLVPVGTFQFGSPTSAEQQSLVDFRAAEREGR
jgi:hypothetical protein